jgi:thymidylate kinase
MNKTPINQSSQAIETKMLNKLQLLIEQLSTNGIRYCHWKSNSSLSQVLTGRTDVDFLIHRKDGDPFRLIMSQFKFRPAGIQGDAPFPAVEHYFAMDEETGIFVHVHAYYRVITGESLSKNLHLPLEEMLLQNLREEASIPVPVKSAELVVFTIRMMLKHTLVVELLMLFRDWKGVRREIEWLMEAKPTDETLKLVEAWLPSVDTRLFSECIDALKIPAPLHRRISLGLQLRSQLSIYARNSRIQAWLSGVQKFSLMAFGRLTRSKRGMILQSGGAVIAFVGAEATGKSTLITEIRHWLGEHFVIDQIHAGKPKSTPLTMIPNLLLPLLRNVLPTYRPSRIETRRASTEQSQKSPEVSPLISAIRSVFLAYDRRALLIRAFARAANGSIVLCDRYPSMSKGAPDGPQLQQFVIDPKRYPIQSWLARTEKRLYLEIPSPDMVISLYVPLEVALIRNKNRGKEEPEDYVRYRHSLASNLEYGNAPIYKINTDQHLETTVLEVKKNIWGDL